MARTRTISPSFFLDEKLADLDFPLRLLFIGLWTLADREGRLEDRPRVIKALIFPWDDVDVDAGLDTLMEFHFVSRYDSSGVPCVEIRNFKKYQRPHPKEAESTLPPAVPCKDTAGNGKAGTNPSSTSSTSSTSCISSKDDEDFEEFWKVYPRKEAKSAARKAYFAARKRGVEKDTLLRAAANYAIARKDEDKKYTAMGSTFLNQDRYEDFQTSTAEPDEVDRYTGWF